MLVPEMGINYWWTALDGPIDMFLSKMGTSVIWVKERKFPTLNIFLDPELQKQINPNSTSGKVQNHGFNMDDLFSW